MSANIQAYKLLVLQCLKYVECIHIDWKNTGIPIRVLFIIVANGPCNWRPTRLEKWADGPWLREGRTIKSTRIKSYFWKFVVIII